MKEFRRILQSKVQRPKTESNSHRKEKAKQKGKFRSDLDNSKMKKIKESSPMKLNSYLFIHFPVLASRTWSGLFGLWRSGSEWHFVAASSGMLHFLGERSIHSSTRARL